VKSYGHLSHGRWARTVALVVIAGILAGCTTARAGTIGPTTTSTTQPATTASPETIATEPTTTQPATTQPATTQPATTQPATTQPATTEPPPPNTISSVVGKVPLPTLSKAFSPVAAGNLAAAITVWRDHQPIFSQASGQRVNGKPTIDDTPFVLASVSKLITALTIARLAEQGKLDVSAPVPWNSMHIGHDPGWDDVTVRELLDHTSGMPPAQSSWLNDPGSCAFPLTEAMSTPPRSTRGQWTYSNGNYCALGLLIEAVTRRRRNVASNSLIFAPIHVSGPHLTTDGLLPNDAPYSNGVARLERLGGAGTWVASTHDLAAMLDSVTPQDMLTLRSPGIMTDQYGWGHTGTVDGAEACAWVMEGGRTVVVAVISGSHPASGSGLCDIAVPAVAVDLGIWAGKPDRAPG
jgi:D-alanyl-D-alanine carboxypeptidase